MAFIRKHRVILVPLFLAVVVSVGLVFLLRSRSEEPASEAPSEPVITTHPWQELVERRSDHMREYKVRRTIEYTDPERGERVTDEVVSTVREVGSNLCYRDAEGRWQPSVAEWEATPTGFKSDRSGYQVYFGATLGAGYTKLVSGKALAMRPRSLVVGDGVHTALVAELDSRVVGRIDPHDPSRLVFANAFGQGVDVEYVLEKAAFHQNVVVRAPIALPEGFHAATTELYIFTELGLDGALMNAGVSLRYADAEVQTAFDGAITPFSKEEPIAFHFTEQLENGEERVHDLFAFGPSCLFEHEQAPHEEVLAERRLWRDPTDRRTYLVERAPYAWLAEAAYPVTLDYVSKSGAISDDEWRADATYYVSSSVYIGSNKTLTIEPGTIIKFSAGSINASNAGAKVIARGEPYNYIVFTSKNDNNSGEQLPGSTGTPARNDYSRALNIDYNASTDSAVEYCKVAFANIGIRMGVGLGEPIQHCIVYDCYYGISPARCGSEKACDVHNCLLLKCASGVCPWHGDEETLEYTISNCTFADGCAKGIELNFNVGGDAPDIELHIHNNLFTDYTSAGIRLCNATYDSMMTWDVECNAFCHDDEDSYYVNIPSSSGWEEIELEASPYDTSADQLGAYFVDIQGNGADLKDVGLGDADDEDLYGDGTAGSNTLFAVTAPEVIDSDIESSAVWNARSVDTDEVDIGYHHPRVDYVVDYEDGSDCILIKEDVTLIIAPGTVVAFHGNSTWQTSWYLKFDPTGDNIMICCDGEPNNLILLAGKPLVSMGIEAQRINSSWNYLIHGFELNQPVGEASFTYARVLGLSRGIRIMIDSDNDVRHCIFERGQSPLYIFGSAKTISASDCLFRYNRRGAILDLSDSASTYTLRNCTFDGNEVNLIIKRGDEGGTADIQDCLFSNAEEGIRISDGAPTTFTHDYNAFYRCGGDANNRKIWLYDTEEEDFIGTNSLNLNDVPDDDPYDTAAQWDWPDLWYLDQSGPCVDGGSRTAYAANVATFTTRHEDLDYDYGAVDIGYHYPTGLDISDLHFDNEAIGDAGEIDILYDYGGNVSNRAIRIYDSDGNLVYEYAPSGSGNVIELTGWAGTDNQNGQNPFDLDTGTYTVVITGGAGGDEYARFHVHIEQESDASLEIQRPDDHQTVDWL